MFNYVKCPHSGDRIGGWSGVEPQFIPARARPSPLTPVHPDAPPLVAGSSPLTPVHPRERPSIGRSSPGTLAHRSFITLHGRLSPVHPHSLPCVTGASLSNEAPGILSLRPFGCQYLGGAHPLVHPWILFGHKGNVRLHFISFHFNTTFAKHLLNIERHRSCQKIIQCLRLARCGAHTED